MDEPTEIECIPPLPTQPLQVNPRPRIGWKVELPNLQAKTLSDREIISHRIAQSVRTRRMELGLSVKDLAEKTKLTRVSIGNYEACRALPGALELVRLAEALELGVEQLLAGPEIPATPQKKTKTGLRVSPSTSLSILEESLVERVRAAADHLARVEELAGFEPTTTIEEIRIGTPRPSGAGALEQFAESLRKRPGMGLDNLACARLAEAAGATCAFVTPGFGISDAFGLFYGERPVILIREPDHTQGCVEAAIQGTYRELAHLLLHGKEFAAPKANANPNPHEPTQSCREAHLFECAFTIPDSHLRQVWREERLAEMDPDNCVHVLKDIFHCRFSLILVRLRQMGLGHPALRGGNLPARTQLKRALMARMEQLAIQQSSEPPWAGVGIPQRTRAGRAAIAWKEPHALAPWKLELGCRTDRLLALACRKDRSILAGVKALGHGPERIRSLERQWLCDQGKEVPTQSP